MTIFHHCNHRGIFVMITFFRDDDVLRFLSCQKHHAAYRYCQEARETVTTMRDHQEDTTVQTTIYPCPYCSLPTTFAFAYGANPFFKCSSCGLIFHPATETFTVAEREHYQSDYYSRSSQDQLTPGRRSLYNHIIRSIEERRRTGSLLDVGCGRGIFLSIAGQRGWSVTGIDPSIASIEEARLSLGGDVWSTTLEDWQTERVFDVVTLINVLDHLADLKKAMDRIKMLLQERGLLYLRFPNGAFYSFIVKRANRLNILPHIRSFLIIHRYCLTPRFIHRLLCDYGFQNISIHNSPLSYGYETKFPGSSAPVIKSLFRNLFFLPLAAMEALSNGRLLWGPSLEVLAFLRSKEDS